GRSPAGRRHGRRQARTRVAGRRGRRADGDRQHRRRHRDPRKPRLPRSRSGDVLAGRRDRRARVGARGRHLRRHGRDAGAGRGRVVLAGGPRSRHLPASRAPGGRRRHPHRGRRRDPPALRRSRARAADERPAGSHAGARPRRVASVSALHDPRARAGSRRRRPLQLRGQGGADGRRARGDRRGAGDRDRPQQSGDLDRPHPRSTGDAGGHSRRRRARGRGLPPGPRSRLEGADRRLPRLGGPAADFRRDRGALHRPDRRTGGRRAGRRGADAGLRRRARRSTPAAGRRPRHPRARRHAGAGL
ncbi:MAG: Lactyl (2) diphospho-(5')guanosine:7,8-didemethyl-8-hydroxy-5-deazariboflavin 2-phospho-L-lactate transferase, partial [uncultured Solirubrobacteraceae bacterium]